MNGLKMAVYNYRSRIVAYFFMVFICLVWVFYAGKDLNWDSLNYHLYAGYSAVEGRLNKDYFAASLQAYFNPYSHVPFYLMVKNNFNPLLIGALFTLFHCINLFCIYEIAIKLSRKKSAFIAGLSVFLAIFFAFTNPIFLQELGSSFNEISTSVFVLGGWLALIHAYDDFKLKWILLAGFLIGLGIALKITNIYFSVTAIPLIALLPINIKSRFYACLMFGLGGLLGILLLGGWWSWQLWEIFRNPVFPLFNNFFQSPDFVPEAVKHYRFIPVDWSTMLLRPFLIAMPIYDTHTETLSPDIRYAVIFLLLALCLFQYIWMKYSYNNEASRAFFYQLQNDRALIGLTMSLILAWFMWLALSGNSRYFLPMASLASVVLACIFTRLFYNQRILLYATIILLIVQSTQISYGVDRRWSPADWGRQWFDLDIPKKLKQNPFLYLSIQVNSDAFLAPFLAQDSRFINVTGQYGISKNAKVQKILDDYNGRIRVLFSGNYKGNILALNILRLDAHLVRFNLQIDKSDCLYIKLHRNYTGLVDNQFSYYTSCQAKPLAWTSAQWSNYFSKKKVIDGIFDKLEALCPLNFQPRGVLTEGDGRLFWRNYINTDTELVKYNRNIIRYRNLYNNEDSKVVGSVDELLLSMPKVIDVCP